MAEQRNSYKGTPPRPWLRVSLVRRDGTPASVELLADTGNPCALIVDRQLMSELKHGEGPDAISNFGPLEAGWVLLDMPEFGQRVYLLGYASEEVVNATRTSCAEFDGLAGLPLLRLFQFGGDAHGFWIHS